MLGLQKWGDFYDNHDNSQTFEQWWQEGWKLGFASQTWAARPRLGSIFEKLLHRKTF